TLGSIRAARRTFHALLGRGQAAASDQGRSCNRRQQAFSHLELSFIGGESPDGERHPRRMVPDYLRIK
ncbi:MAG: hypothetical protein WBW81_09390, partial [Methylocella sp.]